MGRCSSENSESFERLLRQKKITFRYLRENVRKQLMNQWLSIFSKGAQINDIFVDEFLWHIFSYQVVECVKGRKAEEAFNLIDKSKCYLFFQHECDGDGYFLDNVGNFQAEDMEGFADVYVVDHQFNWTFCITHEGLGPYFCNLD